MGCYVNPDGIEKEEFLKSNGKFISSINLFADDNFIVPNYSDLVKNDDLPVIVVDNGNFTAAAVCFSEAEYKRFTRKDDFRPKNIYVCNKDILKSVVDVPGYIQ